MVRNYKDLKIFEKSYNFVLAVQPVINDLPDCEKGNIADQLRRASTSVPLNIAEGCGAKTNKMFLNHLGYSYQSTNEVEVLLSLCKDLNYCESEMIESLLVSLDKIKVAIFRFIRYVESEKGKSNMFERSNWSQ